jgi:DNA-binding GntR family transcriptional regulator
MEMDGASKSFQRNQRVDGRPYTEYTPAMLRPSAESLAPAPPAPFAPITKKLVTEEVLVTLRKAILSGAFAGGDHLVESRLAVQLGVSRAPVREAMFQLEREGLLQIEEGGAALVRKLTRSDMEEIFALRSALEVMAARLACKRLDERTVAALKENIRRTEADQPLLDLTLLDVEFHDLIIDAAGNSRLQAAWLNLRPQLQLWLARLHGRHQAATRQTRTITARAHRELLKDLLSEDPDCVEERLKAHLDGWRKYLDSLEA